MASLGAVWAHPGSTFGAPWGHFWRTLGALWAPLGAPLAHPGSTFGAPWEHFWRTLGHFWRTPGTPLAPLGAGLAHPGSTFGGPCPNHQKVAKSQQNHPKSPKITKNHQKTQKSPKHQKSPKSPCTSDRKSELSPANLESAGGICDLSEARPKRAAKTSADFRPCSVRPWRSPHSRLHATLPYTATGPGIERAAAQQQPAPVPGCCGDAAAALTGAPAPPQFVSATPAKRSPS